MKTFWLSEIIGIRRDTGKPLLLDWMGKAWDQGSLGLGNSNMRTVMMLVSMAPTTMCSNSWVLNKILLKEWMKWRWSSLGSYRKRNSGTRKLWNWGVYFEECSKDPVIRFRGKSQEGANNQSIIPDLGSLHSSGL